MILILVNINVRYFWSGNCLLLQATGCALYSSTPCGSVCPASRLLPTVGLSCHFALTGGRTTFSLKLKGLVLLSRPLKWDIGMWLNLSHSHSSGAGDPKKQGWESGCGDGRCRIQSPKATVWQNELGNPAQVTGSWALLWLGLPFSCPFLGPGSPVFVIFRHSCSVFSVSDFAR